VVTSALLARALKRAGQPSPGRRLVVCAYNLTTEARAVLDETGGTYTTSREFHWTDDRYREVRQPKDRTADRERR
jgi:hypothetical protein